MDCVRNETIVHSLVNNTCSDAKTDRKCKGCGQKGHYITRCPQILNEEGIKLDSYMSKPINCEDDDIIIAQNNFIFGKYKTLSELKSALVQWSFANNKPIDFPQFKFNPDCETNRTRIQGGCKLVACCSTMVVGNTIIDPNPSPSPSLSPTRNYINLPCNFYVAANLSKTKDCIRPLESKNQYYHNISCPGTAIIRNNKEFLRLTTMEDFHLKTVITSATLREVCSDKNVPCHIPQRQRSRLVAELNKIMTEQSQSKRTKKSCENEEER